MVDSGIPRGPGLLATWVPIPDPHMKNANAKINTATIATSVRPPILPSRSLFGMQFFLRFEQLMLDIAVALTRVRFAD
jgi:hypothetical protein